MALFPPEFIAGVLAAFFQIRMRSVFSVASFLINGLSFFLPPEDELIHKLNGGALPQPPSSGPAGGKNSKNGKHDKTTATAVPPLKPLSAEQKMSQFFINVAKTEHGIFQQTIFYELYEMMVILTTSTLAACLFSDALSYWTNAGGSSATLSDRAEISVYGLVSVLMICVWFPLQVKFAQGLDTYESKLGVSIGALGSIVAMYAIFAPKALFDFDLEEAAAIAGARVEIVFRAIGFVDGDMENVAPMAAVLRIALFCNIALLCGVFTATSFLPAFRFARIYAEMAKDSATGFFTKALLHLNVILPLICAICWISPLATDIVVPRAMVPCSPRALTRDCFATPEEEQTAIASRLLVVTESQWHTVRLYVVSLTLIVRLATFRAHLQFFLVEPKEVIVQIVRRPGLVDGELLKNKIRLQFNYVPIIAIQYLAPVGVVMACLVLLARQTATSLGVYDTLSFVLMQLGLVAHQPLAWFTAKDVLPTAAAPDVGGFRIGDDVDGQALTQFVKGMSSYSVVTPQVLASVLGFLIWWFTFTWFLMTVAGLVYWKNVPHGISTTGLSDPFASRSSATAAAASMQMRRNRETPKLLKNQLKSLKMKKH